MAERTAWEYCARTTGSELLPALQAAGREGWELCGQIQHPEHGLVFLFKRPASLIETDLTHAPPGLLVP